MHEKGSHVLEDISLTIPAREERSLQRKYVERTETQIQILNQPLCLFCSMFAASVVFCQKMLTSL